MTPIVVFPLVSTCSPGVGKFIKFAIHSYALVQAFKYQAKRTLLLFCSFSQACLRLHNLSLGSCLFVTQKRDPPFSFKKENGGSPEPSPDAVDASDALDSRRGNGVA